MTMTPVDEPRGYVQKRKTLLASLGYYRHTVKGAPSTTRQTEILNTAVIAAPTDEEGVLVGEDTLSKTAVAHDPLTAYRRGYLDSTNVCTIGDVGAGKSSLMKTVYGIRPLILKGRHVVNVDKKEQDGEGEYTPLARAFGTTSIRLMSDGTGSCLNLLDPALHGKGEGADMLSILQATCEILNDDQPLDPWEMKALRVALKQAIVHARGQGRVQVIGDVLHFLEDVTVGVSPSMKPAARDRIYLAGLTVSFLLERLVDEFPGMVDGETSKDIRLAEKFTHFDISGLPEEGPAIRICMMLINAWTVGTIRANPGKFTTNFLVEEGWYLVGGPMGKIFQKNLKLARALGMSTIVNLHHIADIPTDDPAVAFIKEAQTLHLFRQSRADDAALTERIAGLRPGTQEHLMTLPNGQHFLKVGSRAEIRVRHIRTDLEVGLTDTDGALLLGGKRAA